MGDERRAESGGKLRSLYPLFVRNSSGQKSQTKVKIWKRLWPDKAVSWRQQGAGEEQLSEKGASMLQRILVVWRSINLGALVMGILGFRGVGSVLFTQQLLVRRVPLTEPVLLVGPGCKNLR